MGEAITFKGNKDGIVLMLDGHTDFEVLCQLLVQKLWQSRSFLGDHADLIVNSGEVPLDDGQRLAMKVLLQSLGHTVKEFKPDQPPVKAAAAELLQAMSMVSAFTAERPQSTVEQQPVKSDVESNPAEQPVQAMTAETTVTSYPELSDAFCHLSQGSLVVRKNIRSGQKITCDGTLVIFGDVNAGAELVASGHILVVGTLRGVAHAGCYGDKQAIIYANQLNSLQLRIADMIARAPDGETNQRNVPEIARIMENYLVIEELS